MRDGEHVSPQFTAYHQHDLVVVLALLHNDKLMFFMTCGTPVSSAAEEKGDIRSLGCEVQARAIRAAQHRPATSAQERRAALA